MRDTTNSFRKGIFDGLPICLGYLAVSFAFGISAVGNGLSIFEAVIISMTNVTSAGQLAAVPILAGGGSLYELAVSQLIINLRYALMSVSLSQKLGPSVRMSDRFLIAFMNTDEIFAVASAQPGTVGRRYLYALQLTPYLGTTAQTPVSVGGSTTSKTITGLDNGSSYTFHVTATNAVGTSPAGYRRAFRARADGRSPRSGTAVAGSER